MNLYVYQAASLYVYQAASLYVYQAASLYVYQAASLYVYQAASFETQYSSPFVNFNVHLLTSHTTSYAGLRHSSTREDTNIFQ